MRVLPFFVLFGVSLLLGFTFYDNVPGRTDHQAVAAPANLAPVAYQAARQAVEARLGAGAAPKFPLMRAQLESVRLFPNGHVEITSSVRTKGLIGMTIEKPWTAQLRCTASACTVTKLEVRG